MAIYAQHGFGKGDVLERGIDEGSVDGVVFSPRDETPDALAATLDTLSSRAPDAALLVDPQLYATTIPLARDGQLPNYPYYTSGLTRRDFIGPRDLHRHADEALRFAADLPGLHRMIAPTVHFSDFRDPWSQIALSLAQEAIDVHAGLDAPPLYLSLVFDERALLSRDALDDILDIITMWEVAGFYLVVRTTNATYPVHMEETPLCHLMYLVYVLSEINGFEVCCGYSDLVGLLLSAVGATATASGWWHSLRQFSFARFEPRRHARRPRPRYTSAPLINSVVVGTELAAIAERGHLDDVLSNTDHDRAFGGLSPGDAPWGREADCLHHWAVLAGLSDELAAVSPVEERLDILDQRIAAALGLYRRLDDAGVEFEATSGPRNLDGWRRAIDAFRLDLGLPAAIAAGAMS